MGEIRFLVVATPISRCLIRLKRWRRSAFVFELCNYSFNVPFAIVLAIFSKCNSCSQYTEERFNVLGFLFLVKPKFYGSKL